MKICVAFIGKTEAGPYKELIDTFLNRSKGFLQVECIEFSDVKVSKNTKPDDLKKLEAERVLKRIQPNDRLFLLDEKGKSMNSRKFSEFLEREKDQPGGKLWFLIGGAFGFDSSLYTRANGKISLSPMTMNHQLARVVLSEQIYRALTIMFNHPYHND